MICNITCSNACLIGKFIKHAYFWSTTGSLMLQFLSSFSMNTIPLVTNVFPKVFSYCLEAYQISFYNVPYFHYRSKICWVTCIWPVKYVNAPLCYVMQRILWPTPWDFVLHKYVVFTGKRYTFTLHLNVTQYIILILFAIHIPRN